MLFLITAWIFLYVIIQGYGFVAKKLLSPKENITFIEQFWLGFALFLCILQLISLIFPLGSHVFFILSLVGLLFFIKGQFSIKPVFSVGFIFFLLLSILVAYYCLQDVTWYDTYLYHFNLVRWIHDYPAVAGLANLHSRLGFNSILFLFGAFVDNFFMSGNSVRISLSFLCVAVLATIMNILFTNKSTIQQKIFSVTSILYIVAILLRGLVNSYSSDIGSLLFVILFALYFLSDKQNFKLLIPFVVLSVMFKLSAIPILVFLPYLLFKSKNIIDNLLIPSILGLGYIMRNIIQTGWPLYPLPIFKFPFDWSLSADTVRFATDGIKAYTRMPGENYLESLKMPFSGWFPIWFEAFSQTIEFKLLILAIILYIISFSADIPKKYKNFKLMSLILYSLLGLTYIFVTAPSVRFASIYIYLFLACALIPIVSYIYDKYIKYFMKIQKVIIILFIVSCFSAALYISQSNIRVSFVNIKPFQYDVYPIHQEILSNNIDIVYTPDSGNQCGDSPIPCTPYLNKKLQYRKTGDMSQGFSLNQ